VISGEQLSRRAASGDDTRTLFGDFWILIGLIVYGIAMIFVQIPHGSLIYAIAGLVIFAGLTMFDFQRLRDMDDVTSAPKLAASIFLDALNVFQLFLSLFGGGRGES